MNEAQSRQDGRRTHSGPLVLPASGPSSGGSPKAEHRAHGADRGPDPERERGAARTGSFVAVRGQARSHVLGGDGDGFQNGVAGLAGGEPHGVGGSPCDAGDQALVTDE